MTIPAKVRIGAIDYAVRQVRDFRDGKVRLNGRVDNELALIKLRAEMGPAAKLQTLWHEILHALAYQGRLESYKLGDERAVDGLAWGVMQVLRDNPTLATLAQRAGRVRGSAR